MQATKPTVQYRPYINTPTQWTFFKSSFAYTSKADAELAIASLPEGCAGFVQEEPVEQK